MVLETPLFNASPGRVSALRIHQGVSPRFWCPARDRPRQFATWQFCAASALDLCNGRRIADRHRCENRSCPVFVHCDRVALHGT